MAVSREKVVIVLLLITQIIFWLGIKFPSGDGKETVIFNGSRSVKPDLGIVPDVPSEYMVKAFSFGDEQFYFRANGYQIQNAGDSFGRSTPLKDYDYSKLYKWWMIFDSLDPESNYIASLVAYYYSASQTPKIHSPYIVDYLEQHADRNPAKKWWWYHQAIYRAKNGLDDLDRAMSIANKMAALPRDTKAPIWVWQMPAFIHEEKGEYNDACRIILDILDSFKKEEIAEGELNFMYYFIEERITAMAEKYENSETNPLDPRCQRMIEVIKNKK